MLDDAVYYSRREAAERGLAQNAADPRVRAVHVQLADKYLELAQRAMAAMPVTVGQAAQSVASDASVISIRAAGKFR